ncbi:hypothetical protein LguiA_004951 [Lonicera macranthoides]
MLTNNKRQNHKKHGAVSDNEEDRLSKLPEGIITQILSFLSTREYVRTSILSTRWKYIWSSVPTLDLTYSNFMYKAHGINANFQKINSVDNFLNVVDGLLMGQSQHALDKVHIKGSFSSTHFGSRINAWICAAIERNVRKLHLLGLDSTKPRELHQSLLTSNTLVVLKLDLNVILNFPMASTCFPNLKVLELGCSVTFKDDTSAQNLISSCPVLEDLFISRDYSHNLRTLNLISRSLKKLVLRYNDAVDYDRAVDYDGTVDIIVIDVPALETLDIEGDSGTQEYVLRDLSSIINAKLDVSNEFSENPISYGKCLFELLIKRIFNIKFLQLSWHTMFGFHFLYEEQGTPLESDVVPKCFTSHLKTIKISGGIHEGKEVVSYFLKNAKGLKNLTIETNYYEDLKNLKIDCEDIFMHRRGSMAWSDGKLAISFV